MKNYFIVAATEVDGKYAAYVVKVNNANNLCAVLNDYVHANICNTRKEARAIRDQWVEQYKKNGTYQFD